MRKSLLTDCLHYWITAAKRLRARAMTGVILLLYPLILIAAPAANSFTILSPEEFQATTRALNLESLKQTNQDYKRLNDQVNPPSNNLNPNITTSTSTSTNRVPNNQSVTPTPPAPSTEFSNNDTTPDNANKEADSTNSSNYYFQPSKKDTSTKPNNQGGFNPYGTPGG